MTYNHVFSIAFEIITNTPDGSDVTSEQIKASLDRRIRSLDGDGDIAWLEAIGAPDDTFEVEEANTDEPKRLEVIGNSNPPMFQIGKVYMTIGGDEVLIVGASNQGNSYETVYSIDAKGNAVHRYNRRDYGRTTGTDHKKPVSCNLVKVHLPKTVKEAS